LTSFFSEKEHVVTLPAELRGPKWIKNRFLSRHSTLRADFEIKVVLFHGICFNGMLPAP